MLPRAAFAVGLLLIVAVLPLVLPGFRASQVTRGVIFAVIGLSMNVLLGHAGQISLGHQAFVGLGAFVSGFVASEIGLSFYIAIVISAVFGALSALVLGLVALRIRGLYLALITLAYGNVAEESLFNIRTLTRGGEGMPAPRPAAFAGDRAYLYLCLMILALTLLMDWRLTKSKAGRAIVAIRHDERVAATMGVNVTFYKIFAFMLSGFLAGIAGSLFAHWNTVVVANDFVIEIALVWVFMTVVGGLGSRAGIVIGSAFFALLPFVLESLPVPQTWREALPRVVPLLGAFLLVLTLTLYPGGIGQQLLPIRRWIAGGPFRTPGHGKKHRLRPGATPSEVEARAAESSAETTALPAGAVPGVVPAATSDEQPSDEGPQGDGQPKKRRRLGKKSKASESVEKEGT